MADVGSPLGDYGPAMNVLSAAIDRAGHVTRWARARPVMLDAAFGLAMALLSMVSVAAATGAPHDEPGPVAFALGAAAGLALIGRRRSPSVTAIVVSLLVVTYWALGYGSLLATAGLPALYSIVVHVEQRRQAWLLYGAMAVGLLGVALATALRVDDGVDTLLALEMSLFLIAAGAIGVLVRNWRQIFETTQRRAEDAEADRLAAAERATARERSRIAREMHDVVSHSVSLMVVQASAAQEVAHASPDKAVEVLAQIEAVGRQSLDEMRRMLGVLRTDDTNQHALAPQPSLADVQSAVAQSQQGGVPTELEIVGAARPLSPGLELAAFRIVQEALTNVRKHGGDTATATVTIEYRSNDVALEIANTGRNNTGRNDIASTTAQGHGLIGMHERVDIYGGELVTAPGDDGGFVVSAVLPAGEPSARRVVASAAAELGATR